MTNDGPIYIPTYTVRYVGAYFVQGTEQPAYWSVARDGISLANRFASAAEAEQFAEALRASWREGSREAD